MFFVTDFETSNAADDCYKILKFSPTDLQHCHNHSIKNDEKCQLERKFQIRLSLSSNDTKIALYPSSLRATIVIDDKRDPECCKSSFQINNFTCTIHVSSCEGGV